MSKKLIINADDYGICPEVNDAIENLVKSGKLQNVSILVNSRFYESAVEFLSDNLQCCAGIHLNIVEGSAISSGNQVEALLDKNEQFVNLRQLLTRWIKSPIAVSKAVETEWRAQIELLLKSDLTISHADSHQHIHAFPPFWRILNRLCNEYGILGMRFPREQNNIRQRRLAALALKSSANLCQFFDRQPKSVTNNHFLGFKRAGFYGEAQMIEDIKGLKDGVTELIIHPSLSNGIPYHNLQGEIEFKALSGNNLWQQIEELEIELLTWKDFSRSEKLFFHTQR